MNKTMKNTLRAMIVLAALVLVAQGAAAAEDATATGNAITGDLGVGIAPVSYTHLTLPTKA